MTWQRIEDYKVQSYWKCEEEDCDMGNDDCNLSPTFYQENGTPVCSCGCDMVYQHTEIKRD